MALSARLIMRQGQSLVMTPQLLQAIKLLQYSNLELGAFIEEELERNPLLERAEDRIDLSDLPGEVTSQTDYAGGEDGDYDAAPDGGGDMPTPDWANQDLVVDNAGLEASLGADLDNTFEPDRTITPAERLADAADVGALSATSWTGAGGPGGDGEAANLEAYVAAERSLHDHLLAQLAVAVSDPRAAMIGRALIDAIDEAGYCRDDLNDIAQRLGAEFVQVEAALCIIQTFEPTGVGARDLAECLALQLHERDRLDPAMQALLANLPLLAKRDMAALRRLCGVDDADLFDMAAELRRLDPKPGRAFGSAPMQVAIPDVFVRTAQDGSWLVELNTEALPRVLVNQTYAALISKKANAAEKSFVSSNLQTANWLTKSLEQRARTILKVASEIVRQQDEFFARGVQFLRPLNLRAIADAIGMHESTVSRVTSNKYMATPRGLFELKYFFTASINAHGGGEAHSAEAVRFRIKQLIDAEPAEAVLSDDAIVAQLRGAKIDIARRTVAKYRESLRIPSSVERRRDKLRQPAAR